MAVEVFLLLSTIDLQTALQSTNGFRLIKQELQLPTVNMIASLILHIHPFTLQYRHDTYILTAATLRL